MTLTVKEIEYHKGKKYHLIPPYACFPLNPHFNLRNIKLTR